MRKKAALVLGMAITFSQVAMAEEITSSTEQIENCTPETSVQEENFQETEQQSNVNEVQESVSEDEEVQMQESTIESSEVESEIASELDSTVEESTSELDATSASEVDNDLLQEINCTTDKKLCCESASAEIWNSRTWRNKFNDWKR